MRKFLQIFGLFLIASLVTVSLTAENFEAFAKKAEGVDTKKYGYKTQDLVCGDILCREVEGDRVMRHVAQTVAFQFVDGRTVLAGIEGIGEPEQPTIVLRTGFVMILTVINQDNLPHMLYVEGLGVVTKDLWPGTRDNIVIFSDKEGEFNLLDVASNEIVGKLLVVRGHPSVQIPKLPVPEAPEFTIPDLPITPTIPIPEPRETLIPGFPEIRLPLIPEIGLPSFPEGVIPELPKLTIPAMRVAAPGVIQASVAFDKIDGELQVVGIEGTGQFNPTLVTSPGFLYTLTVINHDSDPHSFIVHGTFMHSGELSQGEGAVLVILPTEEGEFSYYDGVTGTVFGKLQIIEFEPTFP